MARKCLKHFLGFGFGLPIKSLGVGLKNTDAIFCVTNFFNGIKSQKTFPAHKAKELVLCML